MPQHRPSIVSHVLIAALYGTLAACQPQGTMAETSDPPPPLPPLAGTSWQLLEFQSMDDAQGTTRPADPARYTLNFAVDGTVKARLDCNRGAGTWRVEPVSANQGGLEFGPMATTKAMCPEPSMGAMLGQQFSYVRSFTLRDGRLYMSLMADGGIIVWEPAKVTK